MITSLSCWRKGKRADRFPFLLNLCFGLDGLLIGIPFVYFLGDLVSAQILPIQNELIKLVDRGRSPDNLRKRLLEQGVKRRAFPPIVCAGEP